MAEGLTARGLGVTQVEMLPEVLPTVDPELGALVRAELVQHGVAVHTSTTVTKISAGRTTRLRVDGLDLDLSYTPPLGSPWDAVQTATQAWDRASPR